MERIDLSNTFSLPRIVHGMWRLMEWNWSTKETLNFVELALEMGVNAFDHADIYGNYECEKHFGRILAQRPRLRSEIQIITKCGIKLVSDKYSNRKLNYYDTSYEHITQSVERSLKNFNTEYLDLLLIHRSDPFMDPDETARAFEQLLKQGKVLNFGVSNFLPAQFEMLQSRFSEKLITNQIEISPVCLEHFYNGNIEFLLKEKIHPMAWSPLGGGSIFKPKSDKAQILAKKLKKIASQVEVDGIDKIIYAWILNHPAKIVPVVGSGKIERLKSAVEALKIKLNREQWFEILVAGQGYPVP